MGPLLSSAVVAAVLGSGLLAGFFFSFSNTVMGALGRIPAPAGIAAMQSVNVVVQNPLFLLAFFGVPFLGLALAVYALFHLGQAGSLALLVGGVLLAAGMFGVTVVFNVPMNEALAAADPQSQTAAALWQDYLHRWTQWNHVRTVACLLACLAYVMAFRAAG